LQLLFNASITCSTWQSQQLQAGVVDMIQGAAA
jgi:hypothetical protein